MSMSMQEFREMMKSGAQLQYAANVPEGIKDLMEISISNQALLETILENQAFIMAKLNYPDDVEKFQRAHHDFFQEMERDAHEKAVSLRTYFSKMLEERAKN